MSDTNVRRVVVSAIGIEPERSGAFRVASGGRFLAHLSAMKHSVLHLRSGNTSRRREQYRHGLPIVRSTLDTVIVKRKHLYVLIALCMLHDLAVQFALEAIVLRDV